LPQLYITKHEKTKHTQKDSRQKKRGRGIVHKKTKFSQTRTVRKEKGEAKGKEYNIKNSRNPQERKRKQAAEPNRDRD